MKGSYADWAIEQQRLLEDRFLAALDRLARLSFARADFDVAYATAQRALAIDNSLEELHEIALRSLAASGKLAAAHRHLNSYAAYLRDEFGEPLPAALADLLRSSQAAERHLTAV